ncbi:MAG: co-chaperone DjlA [Pseudomonadota bacterium]
MSWWGKILGGTFGMMLGGPIGALLGVALGHNFDKGLNDSEADAALGKQERIQTLFYTATFSVMGHVCKADGRVSEDEISLAQDVMRQMNLNEAQKKLAINLFNEGKKDSFRLTEILNQFRREVGFRPNLIRMFVEIQIMAAFADGEMHQAERHILMTICQHFNIDRVEFERLCSMIAAMHGGQQSGSSNQTGLTLTKAYAVLDLPESADLDEVKKAYRRLMNQHHPDKLVAKGLPEEMMKVAAERTHEIKQAYEFIKQAKG